MEHISLTVHRVLTNPHAQLVISAAFLCIAATWFIYAVWALWPR